MLGLGSSGVVNWCVIFILFMFIQVRTYDINRNKLIWIEQAMNFWY